MTSLGRFVKGAWTEPALPKYTVTAIAKWIVSAESEEDACKVSESLVPVECWEWEAEQRFIVTRICPKCKSTDYSYHGVNMYRPSDIEATYCYKWECNVCGHVFDDAHCEKICEPEV